MGNYDDIINLPHHTSPTRPRMSMIDRAAQFSPFAALTGYDAAVKETARLTDRRIELDEYEKVALDERLCVIDRAAQFSPFAALTGYDAAVKETARLTDRRIELDEYEKVALDERLCVLQEHLKEFPQVKITYFQPDARKSGGSYLSVTGSVKKIDNYEKCIVMADKQKIAIDDIMEITGDIFRVLDNVTI